MLLISFHRKSRFSGGAKLEVAGVMLRKLKNSGVSSLAMQMSPSLSLRGRFWLVHISSIDRVSWASVWRIPKLR
ncbi:hypothetical protein D3C81_1645640 [compost metagenome]